MSISVLREVARDPDGTRRAYEYLFATYDIERNGRFYLDAVYVRTLAPRKRKWLSSVEYSRGLSRHARIKDEKLVSLPQDVVDEVTEKIRSSINFAWWMDRNNGS